MYEEMKMSQYNCFEANAKVLMRLIGLDTQNVNQKNGF